MAGVRIGCARFDTEIWFCFCEMFRTEAFISGNNLRLLKARLFFPGFCCLDYIAIAAPDTWLTTLVSATPFYFWRSYHSAPLLSFPQLQRWSSVSLHFIHADANIFYIIIPNSCTVVVPQYTPFSLLLQPNGPGIQWTRNPHSANAPQIQLRPLKNVAALIHAIGDGIIVVAVTRFDAWWMFVFIPIHCFSL